MPIRHLVAPAVALLAALALPAVAQDAPAAFAGGRVIPVDAPEIDEGYVLVHEGRVISVGEGEPPATHRGEDVVIIDTTGKVVMPGLVDTHSHIGGIGAADASGPIQPGVRVYDSINVRSSGFRRGRARGRTTRNSNPRAGPHA
ncbi:MAG: hypothetical protein AAF995_07995, partial [Planctomycetota bacterium]